MSIQQRFFAGAVFSVVMLSFSAVILSLSSCASALERGISITVSEGTTIPTPESANELSFGLGAEYLFVSEDILENGGWMLMTGTKIEYSVFENFFRCRPYVHAGYVYWPGFLLPAEVFFGGAVLFGLPQFTGFVFGAAPEIGFEGFFFCKYSVQLRYEFYTDPKYNRLGIDFIGTIPINLLRELFF